MNATKEMLYLNRAHVAGMAAALDKGWDCVPEGATTTLVERADMPAELAPGVPFVIRVTTTPIGVFLRVWHRVEGAGEFFHPPPLPFDD